MADIIPVRPQFFNFDAQGLRVVGDPNQPWFVAKDLCAVLEIQNVSQALDSLDDDEKGVCNTYTLGGPQEMLTISESGLYALIFRSRKPQAKLFRRWVTNEVLPTIRRTGSYGHQNRQRIAAPRKPIVGLPQVLAAFDDGPLASGAAHQAVIERHGPISRSTFFVRLSDLASLGRITQIEDGRWAKAKEVAS